MYIIKFKKDIDLKFIFKQLQKLNLNHIANKSTHPNISQPMVLSKSIPLPPLETQKKIVAEIEKIEKEIEILKEENKNIPEKKKEILNKYL